MGSTLTIKACEVQLRVFAGIAHLPKVPLPVLYFELMFWKRVNQFQPLKRFKRILLQCRIVVPHYHEDNLASSGADPDPTYHFDADPDAGSGS